MKLQTPIPLTKAKNQIDYSSQLVLFGSCFSDNIGAKFEHFKFRSLQNPFGILFHPKSIENLISRAVQKDTYTESDIFFHNERWHCFDAHSDLSDVSKKVLLQKLNDGLERTHRQVKESTHAIITLGTAWVYRHVEQNSVVSNCHKIPNNEFNKELLSAIKITEIIKKVDNELQSVNSDLNIIFTISPVRHVKDGFIENQRSKAHLVTAIHQFLSLRAESRSLFYFPSYEIMMDELRDYRFYEGDMIHPNQIAIDYVWEKFKEVWISEKAFSTMDEVDAIQKGLWHRPFNPSSVGHQDFLKSLEEKITYLQQKYPFINF
ncbi:GSCFA domain-containing protein [Maribacter halichondriae]|uniref:GSCFA domain-containing protein n=1 Tax=Maribacter halichondriae TaxID=2980554 RepID=UPI002359F03E|nr:GSCFA domain-containing protein [Maribacter sp. Hal144]